MATIDPLAQYPSAQFAPITDGCSVTPSDSTDNITRSSDNAKVICRGIMVGVSGNLECVLQDGATVVFPSVAAGIFHPIRAKRIKSGSTTATNIVAAW